jgi:short-subunit dehydrogenase
MEHNGRKLALITGGSRGLGFESAKALRAQGFDLILLAKDSSRLQSAATELRSDSRPEMVVTYSIDLESASQTSAQLERSQQLIQISHI